MGVSHLGKRDGPDVAPESRHSRLPATGRRFRRTRLVARRTATPVLGLVANVVEILDKEIVLQSLLDVIPKFHDQNRKAFEIGFDYAS